MQAWERIWVTGAGVEVSTRGAPVPGARRSRVTCTVELLELACCCVLGLLGPEHEGRGRGAVAP